MRDKAALGPGHKRWLYLCFSLLWLSGAAWLYWRYVSDLEAGATQTRLLKVHGAAAMAFLILFGTLLWGHVPSGWAQRRQRVSGAGLTAASGVLALTGWSLYYSAEPLRTIASAAHSVLGLAFPVALFIHLRGAASLRKSRKISS